MLLSLVLPVVVPTNLMNSSLAFLAPQGVVQPPSPDTWSAITATQGFDLTPTGAAVELQSVVAVSCLTISGDTILQAAASLYTSTTIEGMVWEDVTDVVTVGECAGNVADQASNGWRTDAHLGERVTTLGSHPTGGTLVSGLLKSTSGLQVSFSASASYISSVSSSEAAIVTHTLTIGDRCYAMVRQPNQISCTTTREKVCTYVSVYCRPISRLRII
jgi:hypothetical protein